MTEESPWSAPREIARLSRRPIGRKLAEAVARRLQAGGAIFEGHKEYCGHGLFWTKGRFLLTEVLDGGPFEGARHTLWASPEAFVAFLAAQSDYTLAGADPNVPELYAADRFYLNNQRLSRERLRAFARPEKRPLFAGLFRRLA
jgi:hypothetical protein